MLPRCANRSANSMPVILSRSISTTRQQALLDDFRNASAESNVSVPNPDASKRTEVDRRIPLSSSMIAMICFGVDCKASSGYAAGALGLQVAHDICGRSFLRHDESNLRGTEWFLCREPDR